MDIEYFTDHFPEKYKTISIDISDDSTIGTLIARLHEATKIPLYMELKWKKKNVSKVACGYHYLVKENDYEPIRDMEMKINQFPLSSPAGRLRIYINNVSFLVN